MRAFVRTPTAESLAQEHCKMGNQILSGVAGHSGGVLPFRVSTRNNICNRAAFTLGIEQHACFGTEGTQINHFSTTYKIQKPQS
jgi:hypothetical protein